VKGTIVSAWKDGTDAYLAVRVEETDGAVEYIASVPLALLAGLTPAKQKAALVAAVKAARDAQRVMAPAVLAHVGEVDL